MPKGFRVADSKLAVSHREFNRRSIVGRISNTLSRLPTVFELVAPRSLLETGEKLSVATIPAFFSVTIGTCFPLPNQLKTPHS